MSSPENPPATTIPSFTARVLTCVCENPSNKLSGCFCKNLGFEKLRKKEKNTKSKVEIENDFGYGLGKAHTSDGTTWPARLRTSFPLLVKEDQWVIE